MKKFLTGLLASIVTLTTAVASVTSAVGYNPNKDPNGDGVITVADATYIYQCLGGKYKPLDLTQLDVDDNAVVSDADAMYILMHDAGILSTSLTETDSVNAVPYSESSEVYAVYDAKTGKYKRLYTLSVIEPDDYTLQDEINSSNVNDNGDYKNRGVAKIMCSEYGAGYLGTGFVVGKHTIATAAHCLYNVSKDGCRRLDNILLFDANGNPTAFTAVECHIPSAFRSSNLTGSDVCDDDYALITVKEDLSKYMSFNVGMITDEAENLGVWMAGFPQRGRDVNNVNNFNDHYEEIKYGLVSSPGDKYFNHLGDLVGGDSGGPVFIRETLNGRLYNTVIGINVTVSGATRITPQVLKFLVGNTNIQY